MRFHAFSLAAAAGLLIALVGCGSSSPRPTPTTPTATNPNPSPTPGSTPSNPTSPPPATSPGTPGGGGAPGSGGGTSGGGAGGSSGGSPGPSGSGGGGSATTAAVAFVTDGGSGGSGGSSFSGVKVDTAGTASASSAPISLGVAIASLVIPSKNLLFVSTFTPQATGTINGYSFDANGGSIKQVSSTPIADSTFVAADASGATLYSAGYSAGSAQSGGQTFPALYGWSVNASSGALTPLPGSPWELTSYSGGIGKIAVSPNGAWLCADLTIGEATAALVCFQRNSDGTLATSKSIQPISGLQSIQQIAFSHDSQWAFVAGGGDNSIDEGSLANPTSGFNSTYSGGIYSSGVAVDPTGKWIVASNLNSNNIAVFAIGSNGALTAGPTAAAPGKPGQIAFSNSGTYLFAATDAGTVVYSFDPASGALSARSGSPVSGGGGGPVAAW